MTALTEAERLLVACLRGAIHGETAQIDEPFSEKTWKPLLALAAQQRLLPLLAESLDRGEALSALPGEKAALRKKARDLTIRQASRTAEFLLLYESLSRRGLHPAVMKGIVCRSLYPQPEQRFSIDEDLLLAPEDFSACHEALLSEGFRLVDPHAPLENAEEVSYWHKDRRLYLEVHLRPISGRSEAYGDCSRLFDGALERTTELTVYGARIRTLDPTDHLLYLIVHAYKHILYGGVGLRQICDICLFARRCAAEIDWPRVCRSCEELRLRTLAAAFFRIGERHLAIPCPEAFADLETDELPLLRDCLSGGLYGSDDPDRLHSSSLTLEAVAADRSGRSPRGALRSLFPSAGTLAGRYPYLYKCPWLLPAAWSQRLWRYALREKGNASRTLQLGRERAELLKQYGLLSR